MSDAPHPAATVDLAKARRLDPSVIGSTGLRQSGGFVHEEFLPQLRGAKGATTYREMVDNESTLGAVLLVFTSLLRQADWSVQAADDTPEAEDAKTFVEGVLDDMAAPWSAVVAEVASMFAYGYAPLEIVWKRREGEKPGDPLRSSKESDGQVAPAALMLRAQTTIARWEFDKATGAILGLYQQPLDGPQVFIPAEKLLLFRTTEERGNPEGRSILRSAYRSWYLKKRIEEIEAIGIERDLAGLPVAYIPGHLFAADADPAEKALFAAWQAMVTSIRRDKAEGILIPSNRGPDGNLLYDLKLLSSGGSRTFDTTKVIDRYSRGMATAALADFLFLGQQAVGSFALSSDKTALFATALGAFAGGIEGVLNRHLLPRLWRLNGLDAALMPALKCGDLEKPNLAETASYLSALSAAGAPLFPDRELENWFRRAAGWPLAPDDDGGVEGDPLAGLGAVPGGYPALQAAMEQGAAQGAAGAAGDADAA